MKEYFVMDASSIVKEYLDIGGSLESLKQPCANSEFQYLNQKPLEVELPKSSGTECQDFIYKDGIPLISDRMKDFFDDEGVDYLFYKKIILKKSDVGLKETYWLAVPPRINCLNREKSDIDDFLNVADEIVIIDDNTGRYNIFKIAGVNNLDIIVTKEMADELSKKKFAGLHIFKLD